MVKNSLKKYLNFPLCTSQKVKEGNDQDMAQSERNSHTKNLYLENVS